MATDRIIINLSQSVFVAAIPPERVGNAINTFYIGMGIMILGLLPTALINKKYVYNRQLYDSQKEDKEYSHK